LSCGVVGEKAKAGAAAQVEKIKNKKKKKKGKGRKRRDAEEDVVKDDGGRIFGGTKTNIQTYPWQAYYHVSELITDEEEKANWMSIIEDEMLDADDLTFVNDLQTMIDNGEDVDGDLAEILGAIEESFAAQKEIKPATQFLCGGAIISSAYILTAAHCTMKMTDKAGSGVAVGITEIDINEGRIVIPAANWRPIDRAIQHPDWDLPKVINDIALLRLSWTLEFSDSVFPVCLPTSNLCLKEGHMLTVSGWGATENFEDLGLWEQINDKEMDEDGNFVEKEHLRSVKVPIEKLNDCIWTYSNVNSDALGDNFRETFINQKQICAGGEAGKDACGGDSGGPLTVEDSNGVHTLVGLVSWGDFCGKEDFPSVYTRVSGY
jgi:hypothetical protein